MNASRLKAEREQYGWSQIKLAETLGVSATTVRRWERGQAVPYPYYREKLVDLFGKTPQELGLLSSCSVLRADYKSSSEEYHQTPDT